MSRWHKLTIWNELQLLSDASRRLAFLAKGSAQVLHGVPRPRPNECRNSLNFLWILSYFHVFSRSFTYFHVFSPCKNYCKNRCKSESDLISRWPGSWSLRFLRMLGSLGSLCPFLLPRGPDLCSFGLIPNSSFIWFHLTILSQSYHN